LRSVPIRPTSPDRHRTAPPLREQTNNPGAKLYFDLYKQKTN
jgi:hypothetical protein